MVIKMGIKRRETAVGDVDTSVAEAVDGVIEQDDVQEATPVAEKAVAVRAESAVAIARPHIEAKPNVINELAEAGFEGLEINFTSFDTVTLEKASFACSSGKAIKEDFEVQIQKTRNKYLIVSTHPEEDDREAMYSYNPRAATEEPAVMERIKAWHDEDGVGFEVKKYIEALVIMEDDKATGELNGEMMLLQVPPSSIGKMSGHIVQNRLKGVGEPNQYTTVVGVGPKLGEGKKTYYPWTFTLKKD